VARGRLNPTVLRRVLNSRHVAQRSIQIGPKILDGLDTHAQPQQRRRQVLLPRNAGPPFNRGLDRPQAGGVLDELLYGAYGVGGGGVATHVERWSNFSWRRRC
jgi:hypothetical protein